MILSFLEGLVLGFGAAVPLGPINILIMNEAIKRYKNGVAIGLGAMSADITYLSLILFSLMAYLKQPIILNTLSIFGGVFLLYLAYTIFKNRDAKIDTSVQTIEKENIFKLYIKGYLLTFMNPYTIAFWLSLSGYITAKELNPYSVILGLLSAILLWVSAMPYFVHKSRHKISQKMSYSIALVSSVIMFAFSIMMFVNLLELL
ncbi:MAG: lysine transporter LysE [Helicobacteraceae bacterium CG2_30_36_10]|nr:MAG: lysine transporter LysE [Helicobacteraceae bacterium CG2_30_36_10]